MSWIDQIKEDAENMKVKDEENETFQVLSEGSHIVKIDLSTKDKVTVDKGEYGIRTYILFNTVGYHKPLLKLTGYQYGLLIKKISTVIGYPESLTKNIIVIAKVTRGANNKMIYDLTVDRCDADDNTVTV